MQTAIRAPCRENPQGTGNASGNSREQQAREGISHWSFPSKYSGLETNASSRTAIHCAFWIPHWNIRRCLVPLRKRTVCLSCLAGTPCQKPDCETSWTAADSRRRVRGTLEKGVAYLSDPSRIDSYTGNCRRWRSWIGEFVQRIRLEVSALSFPYSQRLAGNLRKTLGTDTENSKESAGSGQGNSGHPE